jgi:hypothetical protein
LIASWMVYALIVSAFLSIAALALEHALAVVHLPKRWAWVGALSSCVGGAVASVL